MSSTLRDADLLALQQVRVLVERADAAAKVFAEYTQEQVDAIVLAMAKAAQAESARLAHMAHDETGFGTPEDKTKKNLFCCVNLYHAIKDMKTVGVLREDHEKKIWEVASPLGVVCAIIPSTNPTSTTMFKVLISLKARNAVVVSPHPNAKQCIAETARVLYEAALQAGAPEGIIGWLTEPTLEATEALMKHRRTAVILATGGHGLVKAAYSSGKPAFGVGPGNVPSYIHSSANVVKAVRDTINGKTFDNGTLCSSEQAIICDEAIETQVIEECKKNGAYFLSEKEIDAVAKVVVTERLAANPQIVGKPATLIAAQAGLTVPSSTRVLIAPLAGVGKKYPLSIEKLSPVLAFYGVKDWKEGCERCVEILNFGGLGHTLALHCNDMEVIRQFALRKPVFRLVVNTVASIGAVGYTTGLFPSMTLGCGAPGGNITSDNISPMHLINIRRVAFETQEYAPTAAPAVESKLPTTSAEMASPPSIQAVPAPLTEVKPTREFIASVVEKFLAKRGVSATPASASRRAAPDAAASEPPKPSTPPASAQDFVCEDDVRRALASNEKIRVHAKTIITPSARELGTAHDVFVRA